MILRRKRRKTAVFKPRKGRQVRWYLDQDSTAHTHRVAVAESPLAAEPATKLLGPSTKTFAISGFVSGSSYMSDRDALLEAFSVGEGTLIHPYSGSHSVIVQRYAVSERASENGIAYLQAQFVLKTREKSWLERTTQSIREAISCDLVDSVDAFLQSGPLDTLLDNLDAFTETIEVAMVPFLKTREALEASRLRLAELRHALAETKKDPAKTREVFSGFLGELKKSQKDRVFTHLDRLHVVSHVACSASIDTRAATLLAAADLAGLPAEALSHQSAAEITEAIDLIRSTIDAATNACNDPNLNIELKRMEAQLVRELRSGKPQPEPREVYTKGRPIVVVAHAQGVDVDVDECLHNQVPDPLHPPATVSFQ